MKKKFNYFFLIIFLSFIYTGNSIAKPRCEELHENVYNDLIRTDVNLYFHQKKKTIGIRLLKVPDKNKKDFVLSKNKDGYFKVGKITKGELSKLIFIDDVILSINDKDIRKIITDPKKIESMVEEISDFFDEDELIKFEILRFDYEKNNFSKIIIDRTQGSAEPNIYNTLETFNEHMSDIYINSINVNEKEGNFDASIETDFYQKLDDRYTLTNKIWESLVYDKKFDDDNKLEDFWWESCIYDDEKWQLLNTADPTYGVYFDNLIKEERQMRFSEFYVQPQWDFKLRENPKDEFDTFLVNDGAQLSYKSKSVYKIKNAFNLKNFPFDKQSLRIFLRQDQNKIGEDRFLVSSWTMRKAEKFKDQNSIQGWNITDVQMNYKVYDHTLKDGFYDGFELVFNIERKSRYYVYKIILPIILILIVCWSAVWIKPYEIESRLTITIVCLLSLIAYNFVIDADLPKLEYLTVMDYIILTSYVYSTIPTFLSILSHNSIGTKNKKIIRIELLSKTYGLLSYIFLILLILIISSSNLPQHTSSALSWALLGAN